MARLSLRPSEGEGVRVVELGLCRRMLQSGIPGHSVKSNHASGEDHVIFVIQCAAGKQENAGHLRTLDGRNVMFVAKPDAAPSGGRDVYAKPDDISATGKSWRTVLREYNLDPTENPLGLLPAWRLYKNPTYKILADHCGQDRLYILSAGWGLIRADFLTPNYDITFSKARNVAPFKRRRHQDTYEDFQLPSSAAESIVFFGCRDYIPLFRKLTAKTKGNRMVFYAGRGLDVPDCTLRRFGDPFTNWHYQCAQAFVEDRLEH